MKSGKRFMTVGQRRALSRLSVGAYACICAALALVVLLGVWGAYRDMQTAVERELRKEIAALRSHAVRTVGRIERGLEEDAASPDLRRVREDQWIRQFWRGMIPRERGRLYAAVIDNEGTVVMHSDPQLERRRLENDWVSQPLGAVAGDVVETDSLALGGGRRAYDIHVSISVGGQSIGQYHAGFDAEWFEQQAAVARRQIQRRWAIVIGGISVVVLLAGISLYYIAYRSAALRNVVDMVRLQRVTELGHIAAGLAHEIRNPLQALRLNLHALGKLHNGRSGLRASDIETIIDESNEEIARLDQLVQELLGFAKPDEARDEEIDLVAELQATLGFVNQDMQCNAVEVDSQIADQTALVRMDPTRLRQIVFNLLVNAKEATGAGGHIDVGLVRHDGQFEIRVSDDGPGVDESNRQYIFDPFYTTKESGSGLGLALVKRFVEEAGGKVECSSSSSRTTFSVSLPAADNARFK